MKLDLAEGIGPQMGLGFDDHYTVILKFDIGDSAESVATQLERAARGIRERIEHAKPRP